MNYDTKRELTVEEVEQMRLDHIANYGTPDLQPSLNAVEPLAPEAPWWATLKGLPSLMQALAQARQDVEVSGAVVTEAETMLKSTHPYARLQAAKESLAKDQARAESITALAKEEALKDFRFNGEKAIYAGVNVKMHHKYEYDLVKVRDWAWEHRPKWFILDTKKLEKAAANDDLDDDLVTVKDDPKVYIDNDLTSYLAE
jgi:hypothetical protein